MSPKIETLVALFNKGRYLEVERIAQEILLDFPNHGFTWKVLGAALNLQGRTMESLVPMRNAAELLPEDAGAHSNLGTALKNLGRLAEAETSCRRALQINPHLVVAHNNLGNVLRNLGRLEEAEASVSRALEIDPNYIQAHSNLTKILIDLGRLEEADANCRRALRIMPDFYNTHWNLALLLLSRGHFTDAWPYHEFRYSPKMQIPIATAPSLPYPQWAGESLVGRSLVIWPEQGFGDLIQFVRYCSLLKRLGLSTLTIFCPLPLRFLFETVEGVDSVVTDPAALPAHDYWSFCLSLPLHFQTTIDTIPSSIPYLHPSPARMDLWRGRVPTGGIRVGLAWKGASIHINDRNRSLPHLSLLAPLWSVPGVSLVSLQKGQGEEEARQSPSSHPILDLGKDIEDFADTAAIVAQLDLVICVDTAIAHVAGALGKQCWVLLPALGCDWRWLRERDDSPWHPGVPRLFRQTREGAGRRP